MLDFPRADTVPQARCEGPSLVHRSFLGVLPRVLLHSISARPPDGEASTTEAVHFGPSSFKYARTNYPVRRVSGVGVEGVERQGCRDDCMDAGGRATQDAKAERRKGPGMALVRRPLERRWTTAWMQEVERRRMPKPSERTRNVAKRSAGPYVGGAFSLRKQRESEAPCKAQPIVTTRKSARCLLRAKSAVARI